MSLLLDTTVLIDALRNIEPVASRVAALEEVPFISAISVEEVRRGMKLEERLATEKLIGSMHVVAVGCVEAELSGDWRREYAANGIQLSQPDTLIAACAHLRGLTLATANVRDFPMPELRVEHWAASER